MGYEVVGLVFFLVGVEEDELLEEVCDVVVVDVLDEVGEDGGVLDEVLPELGDSEGGELR